MRTNRFTNKDLNRITKRVLNEAYIDSFNAEMFYAIQEMAEELINMPTYRQQIKTLKSEIKSLDWAKDEVKLYNKIGNLLIDPVRNMTFKISSISYSASIDFKSNNTFEKVYWDKLLVLVNKAIIAMHNLLRNCDQLVNRIVDNYVHFQNNILHIYAAECDKSLNKLKVIISDLYDFLKRETRKSSYKFYDPESMN